MKLVVGLGNPGGQYINTRHNIGHLVIDALLSRPLPKDFVVKKSNVSMNSSGIFVKNLVEQYRLDLADLWIIHDDLDIPLGSYKIQFGKGPKDHKGLISIDKALGTDEYWHVRVGVDAREQNSGVLGEEYVLEDFSKDEKEVLGGVITEICKKLVTS